MCLSPNHNDRHQIRGFSLIEMLAMIVVVGILVAVAMQSMHVVVGDVRQVRTEREMEKLASAIAGNPAIAQDGIRADFGFVGDNGCFPGSLSDLITNPGLATWRGPYLGDRLVEDTLGYRLDEWGRPYVYNGGITITSTGSGVSITRKLAVSTEDLLYNQVAGKVFDAAGIPPDSTFKDSVLVAITYPDGAGGTASRTLTPLADGSFAFDSVPVGRHRLAVTYTPNSDTLLRPVTVLPRDKQFHTIRFATPIFGNVTPPTSSSTPIGETGALLQAQTGGGANWYSLTFAGSYAAPVVIMQSLSSNDLDPCHLRIRSVTTLGFEWQIEEWDYLDGNHSSEQCPYLVMESGQHTLEDGTVAEAGLTTTNHNWTTVVFSQSFAAVPLVLSAVTTDNDPAACVTRVRNVTVAGFQVRLQEEENADGLHAPETISWIAVDTGSGNNNGNRFIANITAEAVDHAWYLITFAPVFVQAPVVLAQAQTTSDIDPCGIRYQNLTAGSIEVAVEEEKSKTGEQNHGTEAVGYLCWGLSDRILAAP